MPASSVFSHRAIRAGDVLIREGDQADAAYYILSGTFDLVKRVGDSDVHLSTIEKNMIVGEMSMIDGNPRSATVRCVEDGIVVVIDRDTFEEKLQHLDKLTQILLRTLSERLRSRTEDCIRSMATENKRNALPDQPSAALKEMLEAWHKASGADRDLFWRAVWDSMTPGGVDVLMPTGRRCRYTTTVVV